MFLLQDEIDRLKIDRVAGTHCGACRQFVKIYRNKLTAIPVAALIHLARSREPWTHILTYFANLTHIPAAQRGQFAQKVTILKHYAFVEQRPGKRYDGSRKNGFWRATQLGRDFIEAKITAPAAVYVYIDRAEAFSAAHITVQDALGVHFNYDELMRGL